MSGMTDLGELLSHMQPALLPGEFVYVSLPNGAYGDGAELCPVASCVEKEGLSLTVPRERADAAGLAYDGVFRLISLSVHSSLEAVGLTAAISTTLAQHQISANIIAGHYHDHLLVPAGCAEDALNALASIS